MGHHCKEDASAGSLVCANVRVPTFPNVPANAEKSTHIHSFVHPNRIFVVLSTDSAYPNLYTAFSDIGAIHFANI